MPSHFETLLLIILADFVTHFDLSFVTDCWERTECPPMGQSKRDWFISVDTNLTVLCAVTT